MQFKFLATLLAAANLGSTGAVYANTVLDFESPLPGGLVAQSFWQDAYIPNDQKVFDQFLNQGVRISGAAVVALGFGHAASGTNGLAGINGNNQIDYDIPVSFTFFLPGNGATAAQTDYFSYAPDLGGWSYNTITLSAYGLLGELIGQKSYVETGVFGPGSLPTLSGIGLFHSVTIDQTLVNRYSGGIGIDLVQYGNLTVVPEPKIYALLLAGLGMLGWMTRRKQSTA